jgi:hypothetical protein
MRLLPDQIRVAVVERQPVAFTRHGQQIGLVDANGVLLAMPAAMMASTTTRFPVVTGIDPGDPPSRKARMDVYQRLMAELDANGKHNSEQISEIDLTDPEDARVLMPEQGADILAHFGEDHFLERYQRYKAHIAEWRQQYPTWRRWICATTSRWCWRWPLARDRGELPAATPQAVERQAIDCSPDCKPHPAPRSRQAAANHSPRKPVAKRRRTKKQKASRREDNRPKPQEQAKQTRKHAGLHRQSKAARERNKKRARHNAPRDQPAGSLRATPGRSCGAGPVSAMSQKQDNLIVVLDIGSAWTRVLAADLNEGVLRYRGHGIVESAGMRKGLIAELGPAAKAVKAASEQAERVARVNIDECVVGVGGPHIRGLNTNGGFELGRRMREITREDVRTRGARARHRAPADREILHLLPRQFILDEQPGIFDPVGMVGARLEVDLHIATCSGSALQSTVTCANRAGLEVSEAVLESIAAAEARSRPTSANWASACSTSARTPATWRSFSRARWRTRRRCPSAERTLPTTWRSACNAGGAGRGTQAPVRQRRGDRRARNWRRSRSPTRSRACCAAHHCRDSGAARARALYLRERKPAPGRRGGCAGRGLRAHRRRRHAARHAGRDREPVARAGANGFAGASIAYARRAGSSGLCHGHRHALVRASHPRHARGGRQQFARQAARHVCSEFLKQGYKGTRAANENRK